jgi:hypothetical protein
MQFKPDERTATPVNSAEADPHQPMAALAENRVPLEPLTVSSLLTVPAGVEGLLPPGLVMHSALESMTS